MIKSIIQYIKDVKHTMSFSTIDDVIWIYMPLLVCTTTGLVVGIAIAKAIL